LTQLIMKIVNGELSDVSLDTRYNIAPTEDVPVLLRSEEGRWVLKDMRWWLVPAWSPEPSTKFTMFNARSETLQKSRAFSLPFKRQRCVVPVSGYYEWQKQNGGKVPFHLQPADAEGFAFAGLWDTWQKGERRIDSCTIITGPAPFEMAKIHNRIPIHLTGAEVDQWLNLETSSSELERILMPHLRGPIRVTPVSSYVGNARNKDSRCIEPLGDSEIIH
jgi:putative SOS response-associated peptidase YedK